MMNRKHLIVILLNCCIAFGYYLGNLSANETYLSSDLNNIVPICLKMDNPTLYPHDTYLNDLDNVSYYTPFFIKTLQYLATYTHGDYVQALNLLSLFCHLLFGILWYFLLYRIVNNFWAALFVSILLRGTVWLPGFEYWGISDLWSTMPRIVYYSLLPLPFLLLQYANIKRLYVAAFLVGIILNFHPITGLGGILLFVSYLCLVSYFDKKRIMAIFNRKNILSLLCIVVGMSPFIFNYATNISVEVDYDLELYKEALTSKFPTFFTNPTTFWKEWLRLKFLPYVLTIVIFALLVFNKGIQKDRERLRYLLILSAIILVTPNLIAFTEALANQLLGLNIRMAFQLVRIQKLIILAAFFAVLFSIDILYRYQKFQQIFPYFFGGFMLLLVVGKHTVFDNIPLISNDLTRRILPNTLSLGNIPSGAKSDNLNEILVYIRENLPKDAILFAPDFGRVGGQRSVVLESKGANMLIEGNPKRFIQWYKDYKAYKKLSGKEANQFLRDYGVDYVLIYIDLPEFKTIMQKGKWRLYKVDK